MKCNAIVKGKPCNGTMHPGKVMGPDTRITGFTSDCIRSTTSQSLMNCFKCDSCGHTFIPRKMLGNKRLVA